MSESTLLSTTLQNQLHSNTPGEAARAMCIMADYMRVFLREQGHPNTSYLEKCINEVVWEVAAGLPPFAEGQPVTDIRVTLRDAWLRFDSDASDSNDGLRRRSGEVDYSSRVVSFLYSLMRDYVPPGIVEEVVRDASGSPTQFTNGWLAHYASDIAGRLK